jgi:hypothetical protein
MDTERKHGHPESAGYEREDMKTGSIYAFLIVLAVVGIVVTLIVTGAYNAANRYVADHQPEMTPMAAQMKLDPNTRKVHRADVEQFPQPRLETNERLEINDFRLQEEQLLHSYNWVNQPAGQMRIPVDRAMELIAQRGLPTTPQAGTVPPSGVNMVYEAARKSDTSNMQKPGQSPQPPPAAEKPKQ